MKKDFFRHFKAPGLTGGLTFQFFSLPILLVFLAQRSCGPSAANPPASTSLPTGALRQTAPISPTQAPATGLTQAAPKSSARSSDALPTESLTTPMPKPDPVQLVTQGYGQSRTDVGYSFIVANPNKNFAFESSPFQVTAFSAGGALAATASGNVPVIFPGQTVGVGGNLSVDQGISVTRVEIQVSSGNAKFTDFSTPFTVDKVKYRPNDTNPTVAGVIINPYKKVLRKVYVSAVLYDQAGNIIGGGYDFVNLVLANSKTGINFSVTGAGQVSKVELYATLSSLTSLTAGDELPAGVQALTVVQQGFGQDEAQVGFGALILNPNSGFAVDKTLVRVSFYDADGNIIYTDDQYIDTLLPSQTIGVGGGVTIDPNVSVASMDFQINPGSYTSFGAVSAFTAAQTSYVSDPNYPKVTGEISNPYPKDVSNLRVSAVAYNAAGEIIGGGYTYLDFIPANGKMGVEVSVVVSSTPAKIELYASLSSLTAFR